LAEGSWSWRRVCLVEGSCFFPRGQCMFGEGVLILALQGEVCLAEAFWFYLYRAKFFWRRRPDCTSKGRSMFGKVALILALQGEVCLAEASWFYLYRAKFVWRRRPDCTSKGRSMFGKVALILPLQGKVCLAETSWFYLYKAKYVWRRRPDFTPVKVWGPRKVCKRAPLRNKAWKPGVIRPRPIYRIQQ